MKLADRNWAVLATEGQSHAPEGTVYIGKGPKLGYYLNDVFEKVGKFQKEKLTWNQTGTYPDTDYYTPVECWEKVTGLKYSEISEVRIWTKILPGLLDLLGGLTENKGFYTNGFVGAHVQGSTAILCASKVEGRHYLNIVYSLPSNSPVKEVPVEEFISFVKSFPDQKPKEIIINDAITGGSSIKITKNGIEAGCQSYDKSKIVELEVQVNEYLAGRIVNFDGNKPILIRSERIYVDGLSLSIEKFREIVKIFKEIG